MYDYYTDFLSPSQALRYGLMTCPVHPLTLPYWIADTGVLVWKIVSILKMSP